MSAILFLAGVVLFTFWWVALDHGDDGWEYPTLKVSERQHARELAYRIDPGMREEPA